MTQATSGGTGEAMSFEYDLACQKWSWSQGLRDLYGLTREQVPTTDLMLDRMAQADRPALLAALAEQVESGGACSGVCRVVDARGVTHRLVLVGHTGTSGDGRDVFTGFVVDVTRQMRANACDAVTATLTHRATIEQAKGALMLTFGIDDGAAFDLLRTYSSRHNMKLAKVAAHIVAGFSDPAFIRDEPVRSLLDIVAALGGAANPGPSPQNQSAAAR